jgi:hypothetical protein
MTMIDLVASSFCKSFSTSSTAALLIETAPRPIPVRVRISFVASNAFWNDRFNTRPVTPAARESS